MAEQKSGGVKLKKYDRMKKLGLPMASVINRMRMDGVDQKIIDEYSGVSNAPAKTSGDGSDKIIMEIKPTSNMKPLHWAKMTQYQIDDTIWVGVDSVIKNYQIDYSRLDGLFAKKKNTAAARASSKVQAAKDPDNKQSLIAPRRAQNVMIGLARIGLNENEILEAILQMDDDKLPPEKVRNLLPYVPSDAELDMMRTYVKEGGDVTQLSQAESFFVKMLDVAGVKQMLRLWLLKSDFEPRLQHLRAQIDTVQRTLSTLRKSDRLKHVLNVILAVGNYLNSGTPRGNAFGFHIDSLDMLDGLKASDKRTTLLMAIVQEIQRCAPDALKWVDEIGNIDKIIKITTGPVERDVAEIQREVAELHSRFQSHRRTMTRTHSEWAREGGAITLHQFATHIRNISMKPKAFQMSEFANYGTLRAPLTLKAADDEKDSVENTFTRKMYKFHKSANIKVRDIDTEFKKTIQDTKKTCAMFGCEEDTRWEDVFSIFANFRQRFVKALRDLDELSRKREVHMEREQQKAQLAEKFAHRPKEPKFKGGDAETSADAKSDHNSAPKETVLDKYNKAKQKKSNEDDGASQEMWL